MLGKVPMEEILKDYPHKTDGWKVIPMTLYYRDSKTGWEGTNYLQTKDLT